MSDFEEQSIEAEPELDPSSPNSSLTSLTAAVLRGRVEDGRVYAVYGREEYGFPMDDAELDRMDFKHAQYFAVLDKKRFLAPVPDDAEKILDLGCGTGIWCIDFADNYPNSDVLGIDIAPTQPEWVPPNCHFELDDMEEPWTWPEEHFDFIFARDLLLAIRDWPKLIDQAYKHLKPGGWIELESMSGILRCDDGTVPADSALQQFSDNLRTAGDIFQTPVDDATRWREQLERRGFESVTKKMYKIPCNPWPRDQRLKLIGAFQMENLVSNLEGLTTRLFTRGLGWTSDQVNVFHVGVRRDLKNTNYHGYWPFYVVYGRKPGGPPLS